MHNILYTRIMYTCMMFRVSFAYSMLSKNNKGTGKWPRELCQFILLSMFFSEFSLK